MKYLILLMSLLLVHPAHAQGPAGPYSKWFKELRQPSNNISCCDVADCQVIDNEKARWQNGWQVFIAGRWIDVPENQVLSDKAGQGPDGQPVYCAAPDGYSYCFVPGANGM